MKNKNAWMGLVLKPEGPPKHVVFFFLTNILCTTKYVTIQLAIQENIVLPRFSQFLHNFDGELENEQIVSL